MDQPRVRPGMSVISADGHKLGGVVRCDAATFLIEKGIFFPRDWVCPYAEVNLVHGEEVHLKVNRDQLQRVDADRDRDEVDDAAFSAPRGLGALESPAGPSNAAVAAAVEDETPEIPEKHAESRGFSTGFYSSLPEKHH